MAGRNKALQYEASEPAFLRRIREQQGGQDGRHERQIARPKKAKANDEDDAPAYVMEDGSETLSKDDYARLLAKEGQDDEDGAGRMDRPATEDDNVESIGISGKLEGAEPKASGAIPSDGKDSSSTQPQRIAEASVGSKKRKLAKAIGSDEQDDDAQQSTGTSLKKRPKKKGKPIKLSFDDDTGV